MAKGTIKKRTLNSTKNGRPEVRYVIRYDVGLRWDEEKEQYRRVQKEETLQPPPQGNARKHAEKVLAERLSQIHGGEYIEPSSMLFREFLDRWVENYARGHVKEGTLEDYGGYFRNHLLPFFGDKSLAKINVEDVQGFKAAKLADGYAPQTVKHLLRLLRQILQHASEWGYIRHNPAKKVKDPRLLRREMDCLNPEEVRLFLGKASARWYSFFLTAITTGLRLGELLAMKWGNLEWSSGRYFVRETLSRARYEYAGGFTAPKTEGSAQSVDLSPACLAALEEHRKRQAEEKLKAGEGYENEDLVFATRKGTPWDAHNVVNRQFLPALEDSGLRRIRFHDLRHTTASLLINQGVSPKVIQRQLRHASIDTTFDRYGHLFPETHQEAAEKLDAAIFGLQGEESKVVG